MIALAALCGALLGLGVLLVAAGVRGVEPVALRTRHLDVHVEHGVVRSAGAVFAAVLVGAATGWPVGAVLAGAAAFALPALLQEDRAHAVLVARVEAIAGWAEMLRDTIAAAAGLEQAIAATAPIAPPQIRRDVAMLAARLERERLSTALRAFADDVADPTCDLVVAALVLAAEHQAHRLGELLGSLAQAARDQATMRLRVEAGRARTRTSVRVIVGVTIALAAALALLNQTYLEPYDSAVGQLVLLVIGVAFAAGFIWLARMTKPIRPERFLLPTEPVA
ncbi:MAG TPA: pilus assembly protein TadB [Acidimicrobiia bacterium]|jgi:Flp pilus assembly protein TadB